MERLQNFIDNAWRPSSASEALKVINPASAKVLAEVPLSPAADVNAAVAIAERAFRDWRRTPVVERIQPLFRLKTLLEQHRTSSRSPSPMSVERPWPRVKARSCALWRMWRRRAPCRS